MGMSISKMAQLDTIGLSKSTITRKRKQSKEAGLIENQLGSYFQKIIDDKRSYLFLKNLVDRSF